MTQTTNPATCSHNLDSIVGYEVRETIRSGEVLGLEGPVVATFGSSTLYGEAVAKAYEYRVPGSWAVVDNRYDCGCSSREVAYPAHAALVSIR